MLFWQKLYLSAALLAVGFSSFSQETETTPCAADEATIQLKTEHPEWVHLMEEARVLLDEHHENFKTEQSGKKGFVYIIPVVFHVLHNNGPENISNEQIHDCMRILNEDFRKLNPDIGDVVSSFSSITGDAEIEFRLARLDPFGQETSGIDRIITAETFVGDDDSKLNPWPRDKYLNVWTAIEVGVSNAAAYAYRPNAVATIGSSNIDGILSNHTYIGSFGTSTPNRSRTMTHEVGHYLDLPHPWGPNNDSGEPGNCSIDDGIADTPNTIGASGCNLSQFTCGSLDNVQNFMDYSSCEHMFTGGQVSRMRSTLSANVAERNELWQSSNLTATGVDQLWEADFLVDNVVVCVGDPINFLDRSAYGQTDWDWNIQGGTPSTSTDQHPQVVFYSPGLKNVSLEVTNGTETESLSRDNYILVTSNIGAHTPYSEDFESISELPSDNWYPYNRDRDKFQWSHSTTAAFSGSSSAWMRNYSNADGTEDQLLSATIDLSPLTSMEISFRVAYAQRSTGGDNDRLALEVTSDCGENWVPVWGQSGATLATVAATNTAFVPSGQSDWKQVTVSSFPPGIMVENFRMRFVFTNGGGNDLYLDDVEINGVFDPVPVLESPENNGPTQADNVLLNWKAVEGVTGYEYQLDKTSSFDSPDLQQGTTNYIDVSPKNEDTEFQTSGLDHGATYFWRVRSLNNSGSSAWSDPWIFKVSNDGVGLEEFEDPIALKVFPNPTEDYSVITFYLPQAQQTEIAVFDMLGRELFPVDYSYRAAGEQTVNLDVSQLPKGIYLLRLKIGSESRITRIAVN